MDTFDNYEVRHGSLIWIGDLNDDGPKPEIWLSKKQLEDLWEYAKDHGRTVGIRDDGSAYVTARLHGVDGQGPVDEKLLFSV